MKQLSIHAQKLAAAGVVLVALSSNAHAALDFTEITGAVDAASIVTALGVIAGVMMLPRVAKWGYRQVMSMIGR